MLQRFLLPLLLILLFVPAAAQNTPTAPSEQQVRSALQSRGVDEAELRQRLLARGIDIDAASPEELLQLQPQIEAVVQEMEAEKKQAEVAARSADAEEKAVDQGASVSEAIDEVKAAAAAADLPPSDIYGHQVFRNKSLAVYRATNNVTPPGSYPLKPGDEIAVTIFGASQSDFILRLDEQGFVQLENRIRMPLGGVSLGEARKLLASRLKNFYTFRDGQLSIRIQVARTITVNIFGEVENNGSYAMSSINTGFNALVAAGGPTERGSVRNIQLIQGDETTLLDVYEFLQNPTQKTELFVSNDATIFVPPATTVVSLEGGVLRPLRYELKRGEGLGDLIAFAGGTLPRAETSDVRVTRYVSGVLEVINVDLSKNPDFALVNGDEVSVPLVENPVPDFVTVEGAVLLPGRYAFEEGIKVAELVAKGRLRPGARRDVAFLFRTNDDGTERLERVALGADAGAKEVVLQRGDRLQVLSSSAFVDRSFFIVEGAVRDTSVSLPFPTDGALTLEEALLLAGGLSANAAPEVMLIRRPLDNAEDREYKKVNISEAGTTILQPYDRVLVYANERFNDERQVRIGGAVRQPGTFTYNPSLELQDLLYLSGGTRIDAARDRVEVFRLEFVNGAETKTMVTTLDLDAAGDFQLQPFDEIIVRSTAEFETIRNVVVQGEVRYPGSYALLEDNERLSDIIQRAGGLTAEAFPQAATLFRPDGDQGFVVLDLDRAVDNPSDVSNMVLLRNDTLTVPKRRDLVTIYTRGTLADRFGRDSTTQDGTIKVAFQGDKSAEWYVDNYAGGFDPKRARRAWTTVEYANGQVIETKRFLAKNRYPAVLPGASVRVGIKPEKRRRPADERTNWGEVAQATIAGVTTLLTLVLLVDRLGTN